MENAQADSVGGTRDSEDGGARGGRGIERRGAELVRV